MPHILRVLFEFLWSICEKFFNKMETQLYSTVFYFDIHNHLNHEVFNFYQFSKYTDPAHGKVLEKIQVINIW